MAGSAKYDAKAGQKRLNHSFMSDGNVDVCRLKMPARWIRLKTGCDRDAVEYPSFIGAVTNRRECMALILVIDDDAQVRALFRYVLELEGHCVKDAPDGAIAVKLCREQLPDIVFCDIYMPGQDGLQTLRSLRREFPGLKVVAMSGGSPFIAQDFLPLARTLGAVDALEKPVAASRILESLSKALGSS